jgi:hypothetical protein
MRSWQRIFLVTLVGGFILSSVTVTLGREERNCGVSRS